MTGSLDGQGAPNLARLERAQARDGGRKARRCESLLQSLPALAAKRQGDLVARHHHVRLEQGDGTARAPQARVAFVAGSDRAARHEIDDRRAGELARAMLRAQALGDPFLDAGQRIRQAGKAAALAQLPYVFPSRMVTVLQPAGSIASNGLKMRVWICRIEHVDVGGRYRQSC